MILTSGESVGVAEEENITHQVILRVVIFKKSDM